MRKTILYFIIILASGLFNKADCQVGTSAFAFKVKQIDEFFDRFNFDTARFGYLIDILEVQRPEKEINREEILKGLFNRKDTLWNLPEVMNFVDQTVNDTAPLRLSFYDEKWYAEIACIFEYKGRSYPADLVLRNHHIGNNRSYWVITAVKADFLAIPDTVSQMKFLNPSIQGTNFLAIKDALRDHVNVRNYLPVNHTQDLLSVFAHAVYSGDLMLKEKHGIKYHFLQLNDWIFTVEYYNRDDLNAGWLISELIRADASFKKKYSLEQLNIR